MSRLAVLSAMAALAQGSSEPEGAHTSKEWQIWAYSSAAPSYLASGVTVLDGKMEVMKAGTNGFTCLSGNPKGPADPDSGFKDPHEAMAICADGESMKWMQAFMKGEEPKLDKDGFAWMLHGDQGEDNEAPGHTGDKAWKKDHMDTWIESGKHLMIIPKDPAAWKSLTSDYNKGTPFAMFPDNKFTHVMVPVDEYYKHQAQKGGTSAVAQEEPEGPHTSKEWQTWAYSSAAPPYLASCATVFDAKMTELKKGTCGFTCLPANPSGPADPDNGFANPHEAMPLCGDGEAMKWIQAYMKGKKPELALDGWAWMLHGDQGEDNTVVAKTGNKEWKKDHMDTWIESGPHLMLFPKDPEAWKEVSADFNSGKPYMMFKGSEYEHLMVPVENYYKYQAQKVETSRLFDAKEHQLFKDVPSATSALPFLSMALFAVGFGVVLVRVARSRSSSESKEDADESSSAEAGMIE